MKTVLIVVVLLAVTGLLVWFFGFRETDQATSTPTQTTSTSEQETETSEPEAVVAQTVTYSDDGFEPAEISIEVGETVRFINKSSRNMRVASDEHPEHDRYPEFDDTSGTAAGDSYQFTFTKAGTWGYHNHNQPSHVGTVTVE